MSWQGGKDIGIEMRGNFGGYIVLIDGRRGYVIFKGILLVYFDAYSKI